MYNSMLTIKENRIYLYKQLKTNHDRKQNARGPPPKQEPLCYRNRDKTDEKYPFLFIKADFFNVFCYARSIFCFR